MGLDALVGTERSGGSLLITRSRLRLFAQATGQTAPLFVDIDAAKQAGHPDLPVPPTFFFGVDLEVPDPFSYLDEVGVDLRSVMHGAQEFTYHRVAHAGDELHSASKVVDYFDKKDGALQFLITDTPVVDDDGLPVATMRNTLIVRQVPGSHA